jgi:hypothetical protein
MNKLLKFLRLNRRDRALLIITFALLALIRLGLLLLPFRVLQKLLAKVKTYCDSQGRRSIPLDKIIWAVNMSGHYTPGGAKCLAKALTTEVLMDWQGYTPQLRIGVAKGGEESIQAHAWIEYQGQVVMGNLSNLSSFQALLPPEFLQNN